MENSEIEKQTYFTHSAVFLHCRRFPARSIITASKPPGFPFEPYDQTKHGNGYEVCDLDEWREQINRSDS